MAGARTRAIERHLDPDHDSVFGPDSDSDSDVSSGPSLDSDDEFHNDPVFDPEFDWVRASDRDRATDLFARTYKLNRTKGFIILSSISFPTSTPNLTTTLP